MIKRLTRTSLTEKVRSLADSPVLIVGDVMLDHYQFGRVERISPEAPVPVVMVEREEYKLGGACNVARNIKRLGGRPKLIGVCGDCGRGPALTAMLEEEGIEFSLVTESARKTTIKTRIIAHNQQVVRVDNESPRTIDSATVALLHDELRRVRDDYPVIILSDYGKGLVCREFMEGLLDLAGEGRAPRILVDPKVKNFELYRGVTLLTPNTAEASQSVGVPIGGREDIIRAGKRIFGTLECDHLVITLGPEGMAFFESPDRVWGIPTVAQKVFDVTGAGDTVIATIGLGFSAGLGLMESCILSNYAAGIVVGQIGTAAVSPEELIDSIRTLPEISVESWPNPS
jgi:D-glycero-beta-D-manno-heptose-7-phosphate kinase